MKSLSDRISTRRPATPTRGFATAGNIVAQTPVERARADLDRLVELRSRLRDLEGASVTEETPTASDGVAGMLPGGGIRPGGVYSVRGSTALLMSLLAAPSVAGAWCAVVGMPGFGVEAAARAGLDLGRLVLVPRPGAAWLGVTAALADALQVVATMPGSPVADAEAGRLAARLRQRGSTLIVAGAWPRADATVRLAGSRWQGAGRGDGYLARRAIDVWVESRSWGRPRHGGFVLAADGTVGLRDEGTGTPAQPVPLRRAAG